MIPSGNRRFHVSFIYFGLRASYTISCLRFTTAQLARTGLARL